MNISIDPFEWMAALMTNQAIGRLEEGTSESDVRSEIRKTITTTANMMFQAGVLTCYQYSQLVDQEFLKDLMLAITQSLSIYKGLSAEQKIQARQEIRLFIDVGFAQMMND